MSVSQLFQPNNYDLFCNSITTNDATGQGFNYEQLQLGGTYQTTSSSYDPLVSYSFTPNGIGGEKAYVRITITGVQFFTSGSVSNIGVFANGSSLTITDGN
eukprot:Lithocolla_globosa_v1_NODE_2022_length_2204_cov_18.342950.p3 type:complete len:101 gc:universal NODE_2022_length_2204_cov_18.342950:413-715(+)